MLVYYKFMIMLRFYLIYHDLSLIIGHGYMLQCCLNKDQFINSANHTFGSALFTRLHTCLRHTFGSALFTRFINSRMMLKLLTDSLFVAICRSNWLYSCKYGTVWYHPTSSRFYLTVFILCQFQGKLLPRFRILMPGPRA
jgi:hypothetical protein